MPHLLLAVLAGSLLLPGCAGDAEPAAGASPAAASSAGFSADVRANFLGSCLENATNTAGGAATREQLASTCECILGKVEQEYSASEFAEFEGRLLGGSASDQESGRLVRWSTECAEGTR